MFTLRASARDATVKYTLRSVRMRTVRSNRLTLRTVRVHGGVVHFRTLVTLTLTLTLTLTEPWP